MTAPLLEVRNITKRFGGLTAISQPMEPAKQRSLM